MSENNNIDKIINKESEKAGKKAIQARRKSLRLRWENEEKGTEGKEAV